jgi:hypothetical protein
MVCRLYRALCRRWGPRHEGRRLTLSAWAWVHAQETGNVWFRNRIDGAWLLFGGVHAHCQSAFQRGRKRQPTQPASAGFSLPERDIE